MGFWYVSARFSCWSGGNLDMRWRCSRVYSGYFFSDFSRVARAWGTKSLRESIHLSSLLDSAPL